MTTEREERCCAIGNMIEGILGKGEGFIFAMLPFDTPDSMIDLVCNLDEEGLATIMAALNESVQKMGLAGDATLN